MSPATPPTIKREKQGRIRCTLVFTAEEMQKTQKRALQDLGASMDLKGFRPGKAPEAMIRERVPDDRLFEETARRLLSTALPSLLEREKIRPIIPPRVEAVSRDPLTLSVTLIERPAVTVKDIDTISVPKEGPRADAKDVERVMQKILKDERVTELTDALAREKLGADSAAAFRTAVEGMLRQQEEQMDRLRRERLVLDEVKKRTQVDLAPELVDEEMRTLTDDFARDLAARGVSFDDWLKREGKTPADLQKDLKARAEDRLRVRFGMSAIIEEKKIAAAPEEVQAAIEQELRAVPESDRERIRARITPRSDAYGELQWRICVGKAVTALLAQ